MHSYITISVDPTTFLYNAINRCFLNVNKFFLKKNFLGATWTWNKYNSQLTTEKVCPCFKNPLSAQRLSGIAMSFFFVPAVERKITTEVFLMTAPGKSRRPSNLHSTGRPSTRKPVVAVVFRYFLRGRASSPDLVFFVSLDDRECGRSGGSPSLSYSLWFAQRGTR